MKILFILGSVIAGFSNVIQAGMNRQFGDSMGLSMALLINSLVFLAAAVVFYFFCMAMGTAIPGFMQTKMSLLQTVRGVPLWQLVIPGICGFLIVAGIPLAIYKVGALGAILVLIFSQILGGILWDYFVDGIAVSPMRIAGAVIVLAGVAITSFAGKSA